MNEITKTEAILKNNLISIREEHNYTKYYVAKKCNINYAYYSRLENKTVSTCPRFETLEKLANLYKIEVYELLKSK